MALPEVQLGLLPGGGGTQRLPRLVGAQKALDMMLTGKNIFARPALKMGLIDRLADPAKLHRAAVEMALQLTKSPLQRRRKRSLLDRFLDDTSLGRSILFKKARQKVLGMTKGNYPSPMDIIACVETGLQKGMSAGLEEEARLFENLILSPQSRQLVNIFFAMTAKKKNPMADKVRPVHTLAMLGAGFMGQGIAEVSVPKDINVLLKDVKEETISEAKRALWKSFSKKAERRAITPLDAERWMTAVRGQTDYRDFGSADLVIEAVFEDLGLKRRILAEVEANTREDCIFASNTSALPISAIAEGCRRPQNVIGMHYFSPVPKMPLLEIVKTPQTADWVVATCLEIGNLQGKTCIVVNDGPGFYTTRILAPLLNESLLLLEEGADILQIDRAMQAWGFPVGPLTLLDEVGIDVGAHVMGGDLVKHLVAARGNVKMSQALVPMRDAGFVGRKKKKGFYRYDEKGKKIKGQVDPDVYRFFGGNARKSFTDEEIQLRCGLGMVNEAALCLQEGIVENPLDGDVGAIFGLGFPPFRGGPFRYLDAEGRANVLAQIEGLYQQHGDRFKPAEILRGEGKFYA
jgi:3-hydroxyacyl-CoA dehydrogenase/enoyl-CoA hydratase/3-hydroxybutyryl-CoA epimerase